MLGRKMRRDMARHKMQFVSIFLMAFLAIYIYAGVGAEWRGMARSAEDYYEETNLADVWLYGAGFTGAQEDAVAKIPGVVAVERRLDLTAAADLPGSPALDLFFIEDNRISQPYLVEGKAFDADDASGVWLSKRFADAREISVGDKLSVTVSGMTFTGTVRGLVYCPEQVYDYSSDNLTADFSVHGFVYLSTRAFPVQEMLTYTTLLIRAPDAEGLEEKVEEALDGAYSVYMERAAQPSVATFASEQGQHKMMGEVFPIVFLLIALLTILTTMTRLVNGQRLQIGTLKALGFRRGQILRHYVLYGLLLSVFGAAAGMVAGPLNLPYLFYPSMSAFYTVPVWKPAFAPDFALMAAGIVVLCTLVSWVACARLLKDTPAQTLRPKAPKTFKHGLLERTGLWARLGFNAQWNVRNASRNLMRSLMAIIGVFGCTTLVVCAFSMNDALNDLKVWQYEKVNIYESKLVLSEAAAEAQVAKIIRDVDGEAIMEGRVEIRANGVKKTGTLLVTDDTTLIRATGLDLALTTLPEDGVCITQKMADSIGIGVGDQIEWHPYGQSGWIQAEIAAVYRDAVNQGLRMSRQTLEAFGVKYGPTAVLTSEKVTAAPDGVESVSLISDAVAGWDDFATAMYTMTSVLILAAAILSIVVLYNLGLLSFTEMERELATLKVMGLRTSQLRGLLLTQNLWFSCIGFAAGIPGGLWLTEAIALASGDDFEFPVSLHLTTFLIAFFFTFGLSILVNLLFSRKIKRLNMVESLKAVE